ncbi:MAG: hypothetical protein KAT93_04165 [Desulfuromonadales bacterium]|nr:hypothetical protein [Desulfuromonadales bacterium]
MNLFEKLEQAITEEYEEGELPEFLLESLYAVARNQQNYAGKEETVELLLSQIKDFELFADAGCFKGGFDTDDLKKTLALLEG